MYAKKKLIISSYDDLKNPYFAGGGAQAVHQVAKRLINMDYSVTVITGRYPGSKNVTLDGINYIRTGTSFLGAQLDQLTFQICLPYYVLTKKFDFWMESFTPPFSTTFLQIFTKKPVIGLVHMLSGEDMKRKYALPFDFIEKIGLCTYKSIIVTSEAIKNKILLINPQVRIKVISNGIEKTSSEKPNKKQYILFLGRIEIDQKGIDLLLEAYAKVSQHIEMPLYIAGSGESKEESKLHLLIKKYTVSKRVTLLGRVNGKDKEVLFKNAKFVVIPSRFETFSSVALEALAHTRPVICFDIEGLQWIPKNASIKVPPFNVDAFAKAIQKLENTNISAELGLNGQEYASKFTWDAIATEYNTFIQNI